MNPQMTFIKCSGTLGQFLWFIYTNKYLHGYEYIVRSIHLLEIFQGH